MSTTVKNMLTGLFFVGAIAVLVGFVFFLKPSVGDQKQTLYVRFANINKVNVGTRVLFAGRAIGQVTEVDPISHARETQPSDPMGRLFFYQLTLKIDSHVAVYATDDISIQTSGLLGEKSIAITPRSPPRGITPERLTDKTAFYASSVDAIENTFNRISTISEKVETTVDLVKGWFETNHGNLTNAITSLQKITGDVSDGRGTLGKLFTADDMYLRMTAILSKADTTMNDINHYGVLFHLNKSWQKMRTKRAAFLNALDTPGDFKDYFQTEIDQINTSMSRISMLIDQAAAKPAPVLETPHFQKNLAKLMRQVDEMSGNLKLYNQQLQETTE